MAHALLRRLQPTHVPNPLSISATVNRREVEGRNNKAAGIEGEGNQMKFMVIVKASADSEAGKMPPPEVFTAMGKYNEELVKAGVLLAGEGLQPSSKGVRIKFSGDTRIVTDGPFAETKELVAGFWIFNVRSKEEAIEWVKRAPFDGGTEIEVRQVFAPEDFGDAVPKEVLEQEARLRAQGINVG